MVVLVINDFLKGHKRNDLDIVYTAWGNLKKTGDMVTGQVGFRSDKAVRKVRVERRINGK